MKILYVGNFTEYEGGSTTLQRMSAIRSLGHQVICIDSTMPKAWRDNLFIRLTHRLGYPLDISKINKSIKQQISRAPFDLLLIDKVLTVAPQTLQYVQKLCPSCKLIFHSPDDMMHPSNQSKRYITSVPLYDLHITTKSYNLTELKTMGAKDVFYIAKGYDSDIHKPIPLNEDEKAKLGTEVGFIGTFEKARYKDMLALAEAGIRVTIHGSNWQKFVDKHSNLDIRPAPVFGESYVKTIRATKINLCFLRKLARDLHTARSIEIPACAAFMLAERTDEHLALFKEGEEADFFSNRQELISKVKHYLANDIKRNQIAEAGRARCLRDGYSYKERFKSVFDYLLTQGKKE